MKLVGLTGCTAALNIGHPGPLRLRAQPGHQPPRHPGLAVAAAGPPPRPCRGPACPALPCTQPEGA
eukprot:1478127-Alexandrium_andersonii.AAC.1